VAEALRRAGWGRPARPPDLVILFATGGSDLAAIQRAVHDRLGPGVRLFGGSSDSRWVMTDDRLVRGARHGYQSEATANRHALAVMCIRSDALRFGVGSADFGRHASAEEAARAAARQARTDAGASPGERPSAILVTPTLGREEEVLVGIEAVFGRQAVVLGGTAGGPNGGVVGGDGAYEAGLSLAVLYTDLPVGWTFEAGFDVTAPASGVVTQAEGQTIVEIDGQPALDVYDAWLDGKIERISRQAAETDAVRDLLVLHPLYRRFRSPEGQDYFLFSHPWPRDSHRHDRAVNTSTQIRPGERVYLSHGNWGTLANRIGNLPQKAKVQGGLGVSARPFLAIGFVCGGVMGIIPENEQPKLVPLIDYANNGGPFIANVTWGEQGHFPGVGNKHGNLSTGFLVVGRPE
jgi:hypothetical protein